MEIQTIKHEIEVPKETKEIIDFLDKVAAKVKAKAPLAEYSTLIADLYTAVEGAGVVDDEMKSKHKGAALSYLIEKVGGHF